MTPIWPDGKGGVRPTRPCKRCGADTPLYDLMRPEHLRMVGWKACVRLARGDYHVFGARQGLTPEQAAVAQEVWRRLQHTRGRVTGFRRTLRIGGVVSAVKRGLIGNTGWGQKVLAHRGGRMMALHGCHILKAIAPLGADASVASRPAREALLGQPPDIHGLVFQRKTYPDPVHPTTPQLFPYTSEIMHRPGVTWRCSWAGAYVVWLLAIA